MFDNAIAFLKEYRERRIKALNNEERMRWFSTPVENFSELVDETFSSVKENEEWEAAYTSEKDKNNEIKDIVQIQAIRLKIAFLAGCRRDIRTLFVAGGDDRLRTPADYDRYEYSRLAFYNNKLDTLDQIIKAKEKGISGKKSNKG